MSLNLRPLTNTFTLRIGITDLVFHENGTIILNGREIVDDVELVDGMREMVKLSKINRVMED